MHRSQSIILRAVTNAPRYVTNHTLHTVFNIPYVSDVIHERINKHLIKLEAQPNPLLQPLQQPVNNRRLERCWPLDLQGIWSDIAGWTPYHDIVIHHHISLYKGVDKFLTWLTFRCNLFGGENISFDASIVIYIYVYIYINSTNIPPIMIINRIYETQNLLSL